MPYSVVNRYGISEEHAVSETLVAMYQATRRYIPEQSVSVYGNVFQAWSRRTEPKHLLNDDVVSIHSKTSVPSSYTTERIHLVLWTSRNERKVFRCVLLYIDTNTD
jgi:hypothetical protein